MQSNSTLGLGRVDPNGFGEHARWAKAGQTTGDVLSLFQGVFEMVQGTEVAGGGVVLDATVGGAVVGVPLNIAGAAEVTHGISVFGFGWYNLWHSKGVENGEMTG